MIRTLLTAAALALAAPALLSTPAQAQQATPDPQAQAFVERFMDQGFAVLRDKALPRAQARARFRELITQNVALTEIGQRLIRKHRAAATPAQLEAYRRAFPEFVLNAYADRLYDYADAEIKVLRITPRGPFTEVHTRVQRPGQQPVDAIWQVRKSANGEYRINNLTVSNINLSLTQEADFSAQISRNGFDALISFMQSANAKAPR